MKYFCVSYDLIGKNRDHKLITDKLLYELGGKRIQKFVWKLTLEDNWTLVSLKKELTSCIKKKDRLFISRIPKKYVLINSLTSRQ
jgi:CRISPR-associated endonuclease Cas2